jgi:hypothetical protein
MYAGKNKGIKTIARERYLREQAAAARAQAQANAAAQALVVSSVSK